MAFELEHPRELLFILKKDLKREDRLSLFSAIVDEQSDTDSLKKCFEYIRDWNTNAKHCEEAQILLKMILERNTPQKLTSIPGIASFLEAIEAYTARHFDRLQRLHRSTYILDYLLDAMEVLTPESAEDTEAFSETVL